MLTKKEQQTYDFITKYCKKFGEPPLLRQIAEGIGIKSKGVAHRYVDALIKVMLKGRLGDSYCIGSRQVKTNEEIVNIVCDYIL